MQGRKIKPSRHRTFLCNFLLLETGHCSSDAWTARHWQSQHHHHCLLISLHIIFLVHVLKLLKRIWNQHDILFFMSLFFAKQNFVGSYQQFLQTLKPNTQEKSKNVCCKCFLQFNFCNHHRVFLFIFLIKAYSNSLYPIVR